MLIGSAQRRASPTAAGEAGGAQTAYPNPDLLPSGTRRRRLGAGALLSKSVGTIHVYPPASTILSIVIQGKNLLPQAINAGQDDRMGSATA